MARITFAGGNYQRGVTDAAGLILKNRFFEENPALSDDGAALIARPGLKYWTTVGTGPIRGLFSEAGAFGGDLFTVSGDSLFRINRHAQATFLKSGLNSPDAGAVNMAITQAVGTEPEHLFVADGRTLWLYVGPQTTAAGTLTGSGTISSGDRVRIGDIYYQFTTGAVDTGTPDGSSGSPWLVARGADTAGALANLADAVRGSGTDGVTYSTGLLPHPQVNVVSSSATTVSVEAAAAGVQGNAIITTETGANLAWTGGTLSGGTGGEVTAVVTPDDVGIIDVATIASYVICIPVQEGEFIGRFYWIKPGEITIDSLDFATAEGKPDAVLGVKAYGDQFWLPGESSTEVWYPTGQPDTPMERLRGATLDTGTWEGTAVALEGVLILTDGNGSVHVTSGGGSSPVSNPAVEEEIRKAIARQQNFSV